MNERTKKGLGVLEAAVLLGILGDALLRATPWGLNLFLWVGALVAAIVALLERWRRNALTGAGSWLFAPVIFFAAAFAWRDSPALKLLDAVALLTALSLMLLRARAGKILLAGISEYIAGIIAAGLSALFGSFFLLLKDIKWKEIPHRGWSRHVLAIARGLVITVPLLLLFGALFVAADAVFEGIVNNTLRFNFDTLLSHILLAVWFAWIAGGFLRGMLLGRELKTGDGRYSVFSLIHTAKASKTADKDQSNTPQASKSLTLGLIEVGIMLGLLDLLFLCFVLVQVHYLFGGAAWVEASTGVTYAEYARRGFFELVTVAALVLPLLLVTHWLLRKDRPAHERLFRTLAGAQILMLFVIMASAVQRMRLYQNEYGLTELRLYTTAFMGWLALVFIWFAATVLRGQRERFACGALVAGFLFIALLHLLNPDNLIVRSNAIHARAGRTFDASYAVSLSADAVPAIITALPTMSQHDRCVVAAKVLKRWSPLERHDWRTWNWSRANAWGVVRENEATLQRLLRQSEAGPAEGISSDAVHITNSAIR